MRCRTLIGLIALFVTAGSSQANFVTYSNTTNFSGQGFPNGGAANQSGNMITTMVADDINVANYSGQQIVSFTFSVVNFNSVAVSARPLVRFYDNNGAGGLPGTLIAAFDFNPITFAAGGVQLFTATSAFTLPDSSFYAGITFDNNTGATGATLAQLNNFGQGIFSPPTVGTSADFFFKSTAAGSFASNSPAGSLQFFGGTPTASFGWSFTAAGSPVAVPEPTSIAMLGMGAALMFVRRKRLLAAA